MYKLIDGVEETGVYVIFQTISMRVVKIGNRKTIEKHMEELGLTRENGWNLDDSFEIDYRTYNQLCTPY